MIKIGLMGWLMLIWLVSSIALIYFGYQLRKANMEKQERELKEKYEIKKKH